MHAIITSGGDAALAAEGEADVVRTTRAGRGCVGREEGGAHMLTAAPQPSPAPGSQVQLMRTVSSVLAGSSGGGGAARPPQPGGGWGAAAGAGRAPPTLVLAAVWAAATVRTPRGRPLFSVAAQLDALASAQLMLLGANPPALRVVRGGAAGRVRPRRRRIWRPPVSVQPACDAHRTGRGARRVSAAR